MSINNIQKSSFNIKKKSYTKVFDNIPKPINYSETLPVSLKNLKGKGIKVCIVDTGRPDHKDIRNKGHFINFCEENKIDVDKQGHSTILSGIIGAYDPNNIIGVATDVKLLYAKVINDNGECSFNSLVSGVLWGIIKECDVILMALGSNYDYSILKDSIEKAKENNIFVVSACENSKNITFPANYNNVVSIKYSIKNKIEKIKNKEIFCINKRNLYTTYLDNKYIQVSGSSVLSAYCTGILALLIEKHKGNKNRKDFYDFILGELRKVINES